MNAEPSGESPTKHDALSPSSDPVGAKRLIRALRDLLARLRDPAPWTPENDDRPGAASAAGDLSDVSRWGDYIDGGDEEVQAPFLSVVLVVGAASSDQVHDALVALDAQTSSDFELLVVAPPATSTTSRARLRRTDLEGLLREFSSGLATRSRVIDAPESASSRDEAAPEGLGRARGRYVTFLEATSVVFGHFVATFAALETTPAAVLRARAIVQPLRTLTWPDGRRGYEPTGGARRASVERFSPLDHLVRATSLEYPGAPPGSYALRRRDAQLLGLSSGPDELLVEAAVLGGVSERSEEVVVLLHRFEDA